MRRAETVEAVSSVFFFQHQIFVVVRQNHLDAFPGYHAFQEVKSIPRIMHPIVLQTFLNSIRFISVPSIVR